MGMSFLIGRVIAVNKNVYFRWLVDFTFQKHCHENLIGCKSFVQIKLA